MFTLHNPIDKIRLSLRTAHRRPPTTITLLLLLLLLLLLPPLSTTTALETKKKKKEEEKGRYKTAADTTKRLTEGSIVRIDRPTDDRRQVSRHPVARHGIVTSHDQILSARVRTHIARARAPARVRIYIYVSSK